MYGYNQPMNSFTGLFGWKNIKDLRTGLEFSPLHRLKVKAGRKDFWLASTADGLCHAGGTRTVGDIRGNQRARRREHRNVVDSQRDEEHGRGFWREQRVLWRLSAAGAQGSDIHVPHHLHLFQKF